MPRCIPTPISRTQGRSVRFQTRTPSESSSASVPYVMTLADRSELISLGRQRKALQVLDAQRIGDGSSVVPVQSPRLLPHRREVQDAHLDLDQAQRPGRPLRELPEAVLWPCAAGPATARHRPAPGPGTGRGCGAGRRPSSAPVSSGGRSAISATSTTRAATRVNRPSGERQRATSSARRSPPARHRRETSPSTPQTPEPWFGGCSGTIPPSEKNVIRSGSSDSAQGRPGRQRAIRTSASGAVDSGSKKKCSQASATRFTRRPSSVRGSELGS